MTAPTPSLHERMAALREREVVADPSTRSDSQEQSTLATFLILYSRTTNGAYYKEYMQGAEYLLRWLTPVGWSGSKQGCPLLLPPPPSKSVPNMLQSYETLELAKIITASYMDKEQDWTGYMLELVINNSRVYHTLIKEIL